MARRYKCPYRVMPADTGGLTTYQAQDVIKELIGELDKKVDVGHWTLGVDTHKKLGTILVRLEFSMWKKGWSPPKEAIEQALLDEEKKKQKAETKKASSRKSPKKAR